MRPVRRLDSLSALETEAEQFVGDLAPKETGATLVTLSGELGAGKTTFTQSVALALGVRESVTSPTFVLQKTYALPKSSFKKLVHIDAYRLTSGSDLAALGMKDTLLEPSTLILLEWPEMVIDGLPRADVAITLTVDADGARTISYA